jgi:sulfite exporter TauE/SafE
MSHPAFSLFISGLLFGSGPCLASCGPILISYAAATGKNIPKGLGDYLLFSLARLFAYVICVLGIYFLGSFALERLLGRSAQYLYVGGGGFIIFVGLATIAGKRLEFKCWQAAQKKNLLFLGLVVGLLPCGPLLAILSYVGLVSKSWLQSLAYILSFGCGTLISPLILLMGFVGLIPRLGVTSQAALGRVFNLVCGAIIIYFGFQLIRRGF